MLIDINRDWHEPEGADEIECACKARVFNDHSVSGLETRGENPLQTIHRSADNGHLLGCYAGPSEKTGRRLDELR